MQEINFRKNLHSLLDRRKELRQNQTPQEEKLWFQLRGNFLGTKFKRQSSVGGYIADFYCREYKLIVELDGEIHETKESQEYDQIRDNYFTGLGFKVLRFKNSEVEENMETVLKKIKSYFKIQAPHSK